MDFKELLDLFREEKYEEVINKADLIADYNAKFLKIKSYLALKRVKEATEEYETNQDILYIHKPLETIKLFIEILVDSNCSYSEILNKLVPFYESPVLDVEVQNFLKNIEPYLREKIADRSKNEVVLDNFELLYMITSENLSEITKAFDYINGHQNESRLDFLYNEVANYLNDKTEFDSFFGYILSQLIRLGVKKAITFLKNEKYFMVVPANLKEKAEKSNGLYVKVLDYLSKTEEDKEAFGLIVDYAAVGYINVIPEYFENLGEVNTFFKACYLVAQKELNRIVEVPKTLSKVTSDNSNINRYISAILKGTLDLLTSKSS